MSTLSKVMVVLLVLLAIAHSAVLLAYLSQQQDWKALAQAGQQDLKNLWATLSSERIANSENLDRLMDEKQALQTKLTSSDSQLTGAQSKVADLNLKNGALTAENDAFRQELAELNTSLRLSVETQEHVTAQLDRARDTANELKAENTQLQRQVSGMTMDIAKLSADIRSKKERIAFLESEMRKASGRVSSTPAPVAVYSQPAGVISRQPIKGVVKEVNAEQKIATINVGSIAGVSVGTEFIIYDHDTERPYVGNLKITRVLRDQSIGTIVLSAKPVEVGDEVATSLLE